MALLDDNNVIAKLEALATCLCAQFETDGLPPFCFCGLVPGESPMFDYVEDCDGSCGMAWVRLVLASPTTGIGVVSETVNNCGSELGFQVEVGAIRCLMPSDDEEGLTPPSAESYEQATRLQIADMMSMRKALFCCPELGDFILDSYQPYGPAGIAVGGFWMATLSETPHG